MLLEVFTDNLSSRHRGSGVGVNSKHVIYQSDSIWAWGRDPDLMTRPETGPGSHTEKTAQGIICEGISGEKLERCGDTFKIPCYHTHWLDLEQTKAFWFHLILFR